MRKIKNNNSKKKILHDKYLPKKLVDKIFADIFTNNFYGYKTKNNFLTCLERIYYHQMETYHSLNYYVPLGANYWKEVLNHDYKPVVINPLIDMGFIEKKCFGSRNIPEKNTDIQANDITPYNVVVQTDKSGWQKGSVAIRYRINPELTNDDEYLAISFLNKNGKKTILNHSDGQDELSPTLNVNDLNVSIDKTKANYWLESNAEQIFKEYLHLDYADKLPDEYNIKYQLFLNGGSFDTKYCTIKAAKLIAETNNKQLFFYKNEFYISDLQKFKQHRLDHILHYYKREISKIGVLPLVDERNSTNNRLNNYLVGFPSKILQFICINNEPLVQIDLRTSQFLLFANILNVYITKGEAELMNLFKNEKTKAYLRKMVIAIQQHQHALPSMGIDIGSDNYIPTSSSDVIKFINDVFNTDFYKVVQKQLNLPDRGIAKLVLFKLLFTKSNRSDILLKQLSGHYPVVMKIISAFKQIDDQESKSTTHESNDDDYNNFSVFLQCVESEIYIDNILFPLKLQGILCFTRHDSICTIAGHQKFVEEFIKNVFASLGFKYNDKVEDMFWLVFDYYEYEDSGFMDFIIDEITIEDAISETDGFDEIEETKSNTIANQSVVTLSTDEGEDDLVDKDEGDDDDYLNDTQIEIINELSDVGYQEDYSGMIGSDFLGELMNLPLLESEANQLTQEIINLQDGMLHFQQETNEIIRKLLERYECVDQ